MEDARGAISDPEERDQLSFKNDELYSDYDFILEIKNDNLKFEICKASYDDSLRLKRKEIGFYFKHQRQQFIEQLIRDGKAKSYDEAKLDEMFNGAKNYFMTTRLQEEIANYVTHMQSQVKQRQAMRRIEQSVEQLLALLKEPELNNFMLLRYCKWVDSDMRVLRHEPGLFDDTDQPNAFPMILSSNSFNRLRQLRDREDADRKKLTRTEVYDAILQIDFQNEFNNKNGPQDLLKQRLMKVQVEARECIVQLVQNAEEDLKKDEEKTTIHTEKFEELEYEKDWLAAYNDKKISKDAVCQDCKRTLSEAYDDPDQIIKTGNKEVNIPYPFIFHHPGLNAVRKYCCADCGVERRADAELGRFLQLEMSTYCFSYVSMMIKMESNVQTIQSIYYKAQTVFLIQFMICNFLIYKNIFSETEKQDFIEADPFTLLMRVLCAYLFHIQTLEDATSAYRRILFLTRYPDRFHPKMRLATLLLCLQQFFINLLAEVMNLMILCQLPNFNELVMNYVTFAEILVLDDLYIQTQLKYNKDIQEVIEEPSNYPWLQRFKQDKFHRNDKSSKLTKSCEKFIRIIYKLVYFYLLPLLVIPVGYIGYVRDLQIVKEEAGYENYNWTKYMRLHSYHAIQSNVDGDYIRNSSSDFSSNKIFQLYMFAVLTFVGLGLRISQLHILKGMSWNKIMMTNPFHSKSTFIPFVLSMPFFLMAAFSFTMFFCESILPKLGLVGLYFQFVPDENPAYHECRAPYWDAENHDCDFLPWANLYFCGFLIYNLIDADFQDAQLVDYAHFVFKTLGQPLVCYNILNCYFFKFTLEPWLDPFNQTVYSQVPEPGRGAYEIQVKQVAFLIIFIIIKWKFWPIEQGCYAPKLIELPQTEETEQTQEQAPSTQQVNKTNKPNLAGQIKQEPEQEGEPSLADGAVIYEDKKRGFKVGISNSRIINRPIRMIYESFDNPFKEQTEDMHEGGEEMEATKCYSHRSPRYQWNMFYFITFLQVFISFFACNVIGDVSFYIKDEMSGGEPSWLQVEAKKILVEVWKKKVDFWIYYMKLDKAGAFIEVYSTLFLMACSYHFASVIFSAFKREKEKPSEEELIQQKLKELKKMKQQKNIDESELTKSMAQVNKLEKQKKIKQSKGRIYKMKAVWFLLVPFQTYYSINFGLSLWHKLVLQYGFTQTLTNNHDMFEKLNPVVLLMSAFSAPYFLSSYVLQLALQAYDFIYGKYLLPPWHYFRIDFSYNHWEFQWYKFLVFYEVYFIMLIVYLLLVRLRIHNLRQIRQKSSKGHLLTKMASSPYTQLDLPKNEQNTGKSSENKTVCVQCTNCDRIILDGEIFKHCGITKEDYCQNCWVVDADKVLDYLEKAQLSRSTTYRVQKNMSLNTIQNLYTGNFKLVENPESSVNKLAKLITLIIILLTPALMYLLINFILYYLVYLIIFGLVSLYSLKPRVSQLFLAVVFLILAGFYVDKIANTDGEYEDDGLDSTSQKRQDTNKEPLIKSPKSPQSPIFSEKSVESEQVEEGLTFRKMTQVLIPQSKTSHWVMFVITFSIFVSQISMFIAPEGRLAKVFKLDFYTTMLVVLIALLVFEHSIPDRFDQKIAVWISLVGIVCIGNHILNDVIIYYTWHILRISPPELYEQDLHEAQYRDYCCWLKGPNSNCIGGC